jgi:hypothetical protein
MYIGNRKLVKFWYIIFVAIVLFSSLNCSGNLKKHKLPEAKGVIPAEEVQGYVKLAAFQNSDSTWGFTIFVNSRPYIHYKKMPFNGAKAGFLKKEDAERIATGFVKMLRNGDLTPELSDSVIDSLKELNVRK